MALDKDRLGNAMADAVLTCTPNAPVGGDETKLRDLMILLANEIILEFENHGVVNTDVAGVTTGGSTVQGVGTIT